MKLPADLSKIRLLCIGWNWIDVAEGSLKELRDCQDDKTDWLVFEQRGAAGHTFVRVDYVQAFKAVP